MKCEFTHVTNGECPWQTMICEKDVILVLGGTGKTGRRVADRLVQAGKPVRIGSRTRRPALRLGRPRHLGAGPARRERGLCRLPTRPGGARRARNRRGVLRQAIASGVEKLVLLSGRGEVEAEQAEQALQATGADWTILRASWFCQNFSESIFLVDAIAAGEVALPVGPGRRAVRRCRRYRRHRLRGSDAKPGIRDQLYEITGPRALTFRRGDRRDRAGDRAGHPVHRGPACGFSRANWSRAACPARIADLVIYLFTTVLDGRNTPLADGVQRALGRPPRDFSDYVRRTAATGVWGGRHA